MYIYIYIYSGLCKGVGYGRGWLDEMNVHRIPAVRASPPSWGDDLIVQLLIWILILIPVPMRIIIIIAIIIIIIIPMQWLITIIIIMITIIIRFRLAERMTAFTWSPSNSSFARRGLDIWRFYLVRDHSKHRNAKRYNFGCNLPLRGAKQELHRKPHRLAKRNSQYNFLTQAE